MQRTTKIQLVAFLLAIALLTIAWAITDYRDTWFYIILIPILVPNSWWVNLVNKLSKKK